MAAALWAFLQAEAYPHRLPQGAEYFCYSLLVMTAYTAYFFGVMYLGDRKSGRIKSRKRAKAPQSDQSEYDDAESKYDDAHYPIRFVP